MSPRRSTLFLAPLLLIGFVQNFEVFAPSAVAQNSTVDAAKPEELSPGNQKRLEALEQGFFFKLFPKEPTADRLLRLEKQVFGVSMPGTIDGRLDRLQNSLAESDPGTGKPLAPRNDQPKKAVTPPTTPADSATSQIPAQVTGTPPMTPVLTKAEVAAPDPPPPEDNIVLHISKERFDISGIKPDSYIHQVTSAMAMNPQEFSLAFERAKAEIQLNRWDRALSDLCDAINFIPSNPEYYLARAYVYTKLGNSVLARADLKQARFYNTKLPKNIDFEEHGLASKK
jgi:tetratricopeptide (TPR) repeat protein